MDWGISRSFSLLCSILITTSCLVKENQEGMHLDCRFNGMTSLNGQQTGNVVSVDLSHSGISAPPDFPETGLADLKFINLSYNFLKALNENDFLGLPQLQTLDLSHNRISAIQNKSFAGLACLETLRLDFNRLPEVTAEVFYGLSHLATLQLNHNELFVIENNTFDRLTNLLKLNLQGNTISTLDVQAFKGLSALTVLDLSGNKLRYDHSSLPERVFASLRSLQELYAQDNNQDDIGDYPTNVFNDLAALRRLSIDTFHDVYFGPDFAHLQSLQTLDIDSNCRIGLLQNKSFDGLKNTPLQSIRIIHCSTLFKIEVCTFCNFSGLQSLELRSHRLLSMDIVLQSLYGLQHRSMQQVIVDGVGSHLHRATGLDKSNTKYLRNICVKRLILQDCNIERLTPQALYVDEDDGSMHLAQCVEHLDMSRNHIRGNALQLMSVIAHYTHLQSLRFERQQLYSLQDAACLLSNNQQCPSRERWGFVSGLVVGVSLPTTLSYINLSAVTDSYNNPPASFNFIAYNLKTLDISYGLLSSCETTFWGLEALETLEMNGDFCDLINDDIFDHLPSLRHLFLSNSRLTQNDIRTRAHRLFQNLERLEILDLSRNWLIEIEGRRLPKLMHLKELRLSYNSFQTVPVNLDLHSNLTALDLSFNSVPSLTSLERQSLDDLASRHEVRLQLTGNPLLCACSNLDFIRWLWDTSVILDGEGTNTRRYTCTAETGEITDTEHVIDDIEYHWRRCIGQRVFGYTLAAFLLQLLGLLLVYLCCRSWTHVRYFWNVVRRLHLPRRQDFRKDAYVVYADQDTELACLDLPRCLQPYGVRLLLRSLEDAVGSVKAENIVKNIENSWKVLLLVTRAFAEDDWSCGFTVQQAQRNITDTLPNRVLVLFMDDPGTLPPMVSLELLLRNYPERNVFHVHRDTPVEDPVWQRLAEAILGHDI